ncbi:hypothetical protein BRAS3809_3920004 [Bradyrhizobium sp. STM 3809]|nr:hypothetical protein BRAS3809_3920004 [Bradyrhizobium sp. STM 3809]
MIDRVRGRGDRDLQAQCTVGLSRDHDGAADPRGIVRPHVGIAAVRLVLAHEERLDHARGRILGPCRQRDRGHDDDDQRKQPSAATRQAVHLDLPWRSGRRVWIETMFGSAINSGQATDAADETIQAVTPHEQRNQFTAISGEFGNRLP